MRGGGGLLITAAVLAPFVGIAFFIALAVRSDNDWNDKCEAANGTKRQYSTTYILSGKTLVPIPEYECVSSDGKVLFR